MNKWFGASGVCINENRELLMVLQGKPDEEKKWSVPSGGLENNETFEECCLRELSEETGYFGQIFNEIQVKKSWDDVHKIAVEVHYFLVKIVGGKRRIQDPDNLIYDIAWKNIKEVEEINLSFPEDRDFLIKCLRKDNDSFLLSGVRDKRHNLEGKLK